MASACIKVVIKNPRAVKALATAYKIVSETAHDQPWNTELARAAKAIKFAAKHLTTETV